MQQLMHHLDMSGSKSHTDLLHGLCSCSLVPYCTSDSWSGTRAEPSGEAHFSFMGAVVVRQVVKDLLPLGLHNASLLLLTGSR